VGHASLANPIGLLFASALLALSGGRFEPEIKALAEMGGWGAISVCALLYVRYFRILGAGTHAKSSRERQTYDRLRDSLIAGNLASRLYRDWLSITLAAAARFLGDARTKPEPLWTAPSFDRCLLLAFIYPIATIFLLWAITGHVGPAEAALQLPT
jgi:hypothetical protein